MRAQFIFGGIMLKNIILSSSIILATVGAAQALTPAFPDGRPMSQVVDKESYLLNIVQQNRYIEAAISSAVRPIRLYDIDGDGLDQADLENVMNAARARVTAVRIQQWMPYDLNGDSKITRKEVEILERLQSERGSNRGHASEFDKADIDGDGTITLDELRSVDGGEFRAHMHAFGNVDTGGAMGLDANGDGKVTIEEATEAVKATFARFDTNGDGYIDAKEMSAAYAAVQNRRPRGQNF